MSVTAVGGYNFRCRFFYLQCNALVAVPLIHFFNVSLTYKNPYRSWGWIMTPVSFVMNLLHLCPREKICKFELWGN